MILCGFLDTLVRFLSTVRVWIGSIVCNLLFKNDMSNVDLFIFPSRRIFIKQVIEMGLNGVVVGSYGLILWENDGTSFKIISKCLRTTAHFIINSNTKNKQTKT